MTWILVREIPRAVKPREEGLTPSNIKSNETQTPVDSIGFYILRLDITMPVPTRIAPVIVLAANFSLDIVLVVI